MKKFAIVIVLAALMMGGCATKRYGRMTELSGEEASLMDCNDIRREIAECRSFLDTVEGTGFSGADVLAILGDFGIGNIMEKSAAVKSGKNRLDQLYALSEKRGCGVVRDTKYEKKPSFTAK